MAVDIPVDNLVDQFFTQRRRRPLLWHPAL
jgi:hypothetical protein